jgi:D-3-phosphoglycerate dehydrogenase
VSALPILYFDHPFPDPYRDLTDGRAEVVGPDGGLDRADGAIIGARRRWDGAAVAEGSRLRVISRVGVGYDNVDVAGVRAAGVTVCNTPEGPTVSTAEHTITLMLAIARGLPAEQARAREGLPGAPVGTAMEVDGRTLGLVGFGRIARRVARAGSALGMRVVAHDPFIGGDDTAGVELVGLDRLLAESDVISLHAPGGEATRHLLDASTLAAAKRGVLVVNCARGTLIDQDALLAALDDGQVGGAALDVTEPEPLPAGHPLLDHPRVIVTPHIASNTAAGRRRLYSMSIENALNVLAGRPASIVTA